jgi:hypothetical protein
MDEININIKISPHIQLQVKPQTSMSPLDQSYEKF